MENDISRTSEFVKFVSVTRSRGWAAFCLALWLLGLGLSANAQEDTFVTFDVPGAVSGTVGYGINPAGAIAGVYIDANFVQHGFVRASDGGGGEADSGLESSRCRA